MDLQTRKLNLIAYLAQLQDELFFDKLENFILKRAAQEQEKFKPFTVDELITRINVSETDFNNGKTKSQEDLENISANW